jgi:hypothetical protein
MGKDRAVGRPSRRRAPDGRPGPAPAAEVAALLAEHSPAVVALAERARSLVLATLPDCREVVYRGWHGLGYHHPAAGYIGAVFPRADHVELGLERGAFLPDPHGLLRGTGRTVRAVHLAGAGDPPDAWLVELLDAAVAFGSRARSRPRGR